MIGVFNKTSNGLEIMLKKINDFRRESTPMMSIPDLNVVREDEKSNQNVNIESSAKEKSERVTS